MLVIKEVKVNELIKEFRQAHGFSQSDLGDRVGVSHAAISDMERGVTQHIPVLLVDTLIDFCVEMERSKYTSSEEKLKDSKGLKEGK